MAFYAYLCSQAAENRKESFPPPHILNLRYFHTIMEIVRSRNAIVCCVEHSYLTQIQLVELIFGSLIQKLRLPISWEHSYLY